MTKSLFKGFVTFPRYEKVLKTQGYVKNLFLFDKDFLTAVRLTIIIMKLVKARQGKEKHGEAGKVKQTKPILMLRPNLWQLFVAIGLCFYGSDIV